MCVGDPVTIGDYPQGSNNVDVTATGLLALVNQGFNEGRDRAGSSIGEPTSFFTGAAVAPSAPDLERECRLLVRKVDAGARFLLSQPVYDVEPVASAAIDVSSGSRAVRSMCRSSRACCRSTPRVMPSSSTTRSRASSSRKPSVLDCAAAGDDGWRVGLAMAVELVEELRADGVAGIYLMPQFGRFDRAAELVETIRTPIGGRSRPVGSGG